MKEYLIIFEVNQIVVKTDGELVTIPILERNTFCIGEKDLYDIIIKNKIELEIRLKKLEESLRSKNKKKR